MGIKTIQYYFYSNYFTTVTIKSHTKKCSTLLNLHFEQPNSHPDLNKCK